MTTRRSHQLETYLLCQGLYAGKRTQLIAWLALGGQKQGFGAGSPLIPHDSKDANPATFLLFCPLELDGSANWLYIGRMTNQKQPTTYETKVVTREAAGRVECRPARKALLGGEEASGRPRALRPRRGIRGTGKDDRRGDQGDDDEAACFYVYLVV